MSERVSEQVLEFLYANGGRGRLSEIARGIGRSPAGVHYALRLLEKIGFVERDGEYWCIRQDVYRRHVYAKYTWVFLTSVAVFLCTMGLLLYMATGYGRLSALANAFSTIVLTLLLYEVLVASEARWIRREEKKRKREKKDGLNRVQGAGEA